MMTSSQGNEETVVSIIRINDFWKRFLDRMTVGVAVTMSAALADWFLRSATQWISQGEVNFMFINFYLIMAGVITIGITVFDGVRIVQTRTWSRTLLPDLLGFWIGAAITFGIVYYLIVPIWQALVSA